jgi:hypothetical protein
VKTKFPSDLADALAVQGLSLHEKAAQLDVQRNAELESMKRETIALAEGELVARQATVDMKRDMAQSSKRDKEKLLGRRQEINRTQSPKESDTACDASLVIDIYHCLGANLSFVSTRR